MKILFEGQYLHTFLQDLQLGVSGEEGSDDDDDMPSTDECVAKIASLLG